MDRRLHLILGIAPLDLLLDPADAQHPSVEREKKLRLVARRRALEAAYSLAGVWVTNRHNPSGWYNTMRQPDMSKRTGTAMRLRSASRTRARSPGRTNSSMNPPPPAPSSLPPTAPAASADSYIASMTPLVTRFDRPRFSFHDSCNSFPKSAMSLDGADSSAIASSTICCIVVSACVCSRRLSTIVCATSVDVREMPVNTSNR